MRGQLFLCQSLQTLLCQAADAGAAPFGRALDRLTECFRNPHRNLSSSSPTPLLDLRSPITPVEDGIMILSRKSWPKILAGPPFDGRHLPLRQLFPCQRRPPPASGFPEGEDEIFDLFEGRRRQPFKRLYDLSLRGHVCLLKSGTCHMQLLAQKLATGETHSHFEACFSVAFFMR
jgi:hypothetical protein